MGLTINSKQKVELRRYSSEARRTSGQDLANIEKIFGIVVIDTQIRVFLIPIYLEGPIAVVSSESESIDIYTAGFNNLLARGIILHLK